MTLHAVMVAHNEAHRYLDSVLSALPTDSVHLYDDCSTDDTVQIALKHGVSVTRRDTDRIPSFVQDEGAFRQAGWEAFERRLHPEEGDWVVALDCDEYLVGDGVQQLTYPRCGYLSNYPVHTTHVQIPVLELFKALKPPTKVNPPEFWERVDGFWPTQQALRFVRYRKGMKFDLSQKNSGSVPDRIGTVVTAGPAGISLAHMGYAEESDRVSKHLYYSLVAGHGHNTNHIASIIQTPTLRKVELKMPDVWRGVR